MIRRTYGALSLAVALVAGSNAVHAQDQAASQTPAQSQTGMIGQQVPGAATQPGMLGQDGGHEAHAQQMMQQMTQRMNAMIPQGNPDVNFAGMMAAHHQSGIEMAREYLKHGKDEKLRKMAQKMIDEQEKEIKDLQERRDANSKGEAKSGDNKKDPDDNASENKKND